jgi:hypothetical protein
MDEIATRSELVPFGQLIGDEAVDNWVVVDQMSGDSVFSTHYFCRTCWAEIGGYHQHFVICCPFCATPMPYVGTFSDRKHAQYHGSWPYDLLRLRWAQEHCHFWGGDNPWTLSEDGKMLSELERCRRLDGHAGEHRYEGEWERFAVNPFGGE